MRSNIRALLSASVLVVLSAGAWADSIYKCRNPQGDLIYQDAPCAQDTKTVSSRKAITEAEQQENEPAVVNNGVLIIKQRGNGHFYLDGTINGKALTFVVDTGASAVILPRPLALSAQIYCKDQVLMQTAKGTASACTAIIPKLGFGPFQLRNVPAVISPDLRQPLLGMSVLQQFRIEQEKGEMRISARN